MCNDSDVRLVSQGADTVIQQSPYREFCPNYEMQLIQSICLHILLDHWYLVRTSTFSDEPIVTNAADTSSCPMHSTTAGSSTG